MISHPTMIQYQWQALVFGVVLLCFLSNAQSTSISDEIAQRKLNCTAILIEKPKEREVSIAKFGVFISHLLSSLVEF